MNTTAPHPSVANRSLRTIARRGLMASLAVAGALAATAATASAAIVINEVESDDQVVADFVEIMNTGAAPVDIGNYVIKDNDDGHAKLIPPVTMLAPNATTSSTPTAARAPSASARTTPRGSTAPAASPWSTATRGPGTRPPPSAAAPTARAP